MVMEKAASIIEFLLKNKSHDHGSKYEEVKREANLLVISPLKLMGYLVVIFGVLAMVFEVRYFNSFSLEIYNIRLTAVFVALFVLAILNSKFAVKYSITLVHLLLLSIILSSAMMVYYIPKTLLVNSQIVGLIIFTSALFLSWEVRHQIIVAIYYNIVFAGAILLSDGSVYFLPNVPESVAFVSLLSLVSVIACAFNFRMRLMLAEKSFKIELSNKKYRSMFDNSVEGIFQSTADGRFLTINRAFAEILGYNDENELTEVDIKKIYVNPDERQELIRKLRKDGYVKDYQVELRKKDGKSVFARLNDRLVKDEKGQQFMEGNIQDITEKVLLDREKFAALDALKKEKEKSEKLAQEAIRLTGNKSKFLANMSHEIRTPMNGILGFLTLIEAGAYKNEEELKQFTSSARNSTELLIEIINSILDLSKIESGKVELEHVDFDLTGVIDHAISILSTKINEKGVKIVKDLPGDSQLHLNGDPTKLRQIFINLLANAVKFTSEGEIKVKVITEKAGEDNIVLKASIMDSGIGIPADKINNLFKPFSQITGVETRSFGGTGLGLVICREYITLMDGEIGVTSEQGKGSSFNFTARLKRSKSPIEEKTKIENNPDLKTVERTSANSEFSLKTIRGQFDILLAEDNLINQKVLLKILQASGYKAYSVGNGAEAVAAVKKGHYHLVLMDIQMPEVDGFSATAQIRSLEDDKKNTIIIALTAHALMGDREKCLAAGMNEYIPKPIIAKDLLEMMDKLLDVKNALVPKPVKEEASNDSIFDFDRLKRISADDSDFEKDLVGSYIEDVEQKYKQLDEYFSAGDVESIVKLAHTIKGASYSIGAQRVGDEAFGIEISGKSNDMMSIGERLPQFKKALDETLKILNGILEPQ
ncbi:response regulator [bacterium BMS3Abin03]|nr:response regulator [bacterium BMS3Abin03]